MTKKEEWLAGTRSAVPIMLGYVPVGIAYGVMARQAGLNTWQTVLMSLTVYGGASEMMAAGMVAQGAAVLPRVLPAFLMGRIRLNARVEHFLQLIPYTAMTALVFPGVFSVDANPVLGVVGAAVAGGLAWKKCPIIVCVLAAVAVEAVMLLVQGSGMLWSVVVVAG